MFLEKFGLKLLGFVGLVWLLGAFTPVLARPTASIYEFSSTYYINNGPEAQCDNTGSGTSPDRPWCDFGPVNRHGPFEAGDHILLARGATWNQEMNLSGNGTATNPILLGAYGAGNRPIISRNEGADERGIRLTNPDYWKIQDLEVAHAGACIMIFFTSLGHNGLAFSNIYVHHCFGVHQSRDKSGEVNVLSGQEHMWNSAGIIITGKLPWPYHDGDLAIRGVRMDNIEGTHNFASVSFDFLGHGQYDLTAEGGDYHGVAQDVVLNHLYFHDDDNPMSSSGGCDEGLRLFALQHAVVMNSILDHEAACYSRTGTTAVILGRLKDVAIVNSIVKNIPATGSTDQDAFDYEYFTEGVSIRNTLMANTAGPGIGFIQFRPAPPDHLNGAEASGNVFVNNLAAFNIYNDQNSPISGLLRDNLGTNEVYYREQIGTFEGFTKINNRTIETAADIFQAAEGFSPTSPANGWSYQYYDGNSYRNLDYFEPVERVWQPSAALNLPQIGQFDQHPDSTPGGWVARAWTAPASGTLSLRGRILKSDGTGGGNGVGVRITRNGSPIWPVAGSQNLAGDDEYRGIDYVVDDLAVKAGDVLRFETNCNGDINYDKTSWVPVVAYTARKP